ncbi:MAG: hypothetical protein ABII96_11045, partial [Candidatus Zixiibacteriota bacterium]
MKKYFRVLFIILLIAFSFFDGIATSHRTVVTTLPADYPEAIPQKGPYLSEVTSNSIIISWRTVGQDSSVILYGLTPVYDYEENDTTLTTA